MRNFRNFIFFFLSSFITIISLISEENETILFAWQIHRHGARAPYLGVQNGIDVYKEEWTQIEELSEVGKRMLYLLGVKVRKRYIEKYKLLSDKYNPQEIYIRSTDKNRTIESIESLLQGLYPDGTGPTIEGKLLETNITYPPNEKYKDDFDQIIKNYSLNENKWALPFGMAVQPVHLFNKFIHEYQLYDPGICAGHKALNEKLKQRKEVFDFGDNLIKNFSFFSDLENVDPSNTTFMHDYWTIYKYMDGFICDNTDQRNFTYMKEKYNFSSKKDLLENASNEFLRMDYFDTNYPEGNKDIPIVANTYTMHSLVNWMEKAIKGYNNSKYIKFVIFSAHDASIGALEHYMKYVFEVNPEYSTFAESRFFELYRNSKGEERVRYLKGDNEVKKDISFSEFKDKINKETWDDDKIAEYCQFEKVQKNDDNIDIIAMILLSVINLVLIIILILSCTK